LAIQHWDIYTIINEKGCSMSEAWDGLHLKFTFKRTVDSRTMNLWYEIMQIASGIVFSEEEDVIIWQFSSSGRYSIQSLYAVINDRGIKQVYTPVVWKILVPPRLHIFLWLLSNNKVLTRDNLAKRQQVDDPTCLFCDGMEIAHHLFFGCCVAKVMWCNLSDVVGKELGNDFESIVWLWLCDKKLKTLNICTTAVLCTL
jgi:hypothetical protein